MSLFRTPVSLGGRTDVRILSRLFVRVILHTYHLEPLQAQTLAIYRRMARSLIHAQWRPALQMTIIKDSQSNHLHPSPGSHSNIFFFSLNGYPEEEAALWCTKRKAIPHLSYRISCAF